MSNSLIDFESSREKEKQREWEREARKAILEKAKNEYEIKKSREDQARQRGEHTWMLPSVEANLDDSKMKKKKKKKEKKKKKKKEKKSKKTKKDDSSSSSDSEDERWIEKSGPSVSKEVKSVPMMKKPEDEDNVETAQPKRDGWMEMTSLFGTFSREKMREREGTSRKIAKEEELKRRREEEKPGSHALELNPYFKNGGTGLPEEEPKTKVSSGFDAAWLRRALHRAEEQAKAENTSLEEVAAHRWGSLAKFYELLAEAEGQERKPVKNQGQEWRNARDKGWRRRDRSSSRDRRRDRSGSRDRRRDRSGSRDRRRDRSGSRDRRRDRSGSRDRRRDRSGSRDRRRDRSRSGSEDRREKSKMLRGSRSRETNSRSRSKERSKQTRRRHRSDSSSSSSSSNRKHTRKSEKKFDSKEETQRLTKSFMRPPRDDDSEKSSFLSSKFQKPGEGRNISYAGNVSASSSGTGKSWQKKVATQHTSSQKKESSSSSSSDSDSSDSEEETSKMLLPKKESEAPADVEGPSAAPKLLTDKEMNELAAKIMKAELIGNEGQASKLKKKLEAARSARASAPAGSRIDEDNVKEEVVVLSRMDARGVSRPILGSVPENDGKRRKKMKTHDKDGQRTKYFPDDDKYDLKRMFEIEKGTTAEDQNSLFERAAFNSSEKFNEDYDMDDMFMTKSVRKETTAKQAERDRQKAVEEHRRSERSLESCQLCFDSKDMPKHLIVALGTKAYVCLPPHQSLTPGHCFIVPIHHVACGVQADEDLWSEIQNFRKSLVKMFNSRDEDCIFFETVKRLRSYPHMVINCVPLPREMGDMAPIYFKKAIMECEAEWAQNKKLVDLKNRDVRRAVPKGLPYFFVDFAMDSGFAHVIEDEQDFPHNFAQEIVGGMLDLDANLWRKPRRENFDVQRKKVMEFSSWYKEFDPTQDT